jgi:hypothetical protein
MTPAKETAVSIVFQGWIGRFVSDTIPKWLAGRHLSRERALRDPSLEQRTRFDIQRYQRVTAGSTSCERAIVMEGLRG